MVELCKIKFIARKITKCFLMFMAGLTQFILSSRINLTNCVDEMLAKNHCFLPIYL